MNQKKHILKPGNHQFAPGSPAVHNNNNLSDEDARWYLEKYPHIAALFENIPKDTINQSVQSESIISKIPDQSVQSESIISEIPNINEDLPATN